jgi:cysteine desulfurase
MQPIYLDHSATTPIRPEVLDAMLPWLGECFGNPSSTHRWGRQARAALDEARQRLAAALGARPLEIVFTHGGTEADNLAIVGRSRTEPGAPVACTAIEHKAILAAAHAAEAEGAPLAVLPVDENGVVRLEALDEVLASRPSVVSVMWANNEVGAVQPVAEIAARCQAAGVVFHTDAVQAFGKVAVRVDEVPVGLLSLSAHKINGPKGIGALFVRRKVGLTPLTHGGGQERGLCPGTENVAGAVGFAVAAELAAAEREALMRRVGALRDRLEGALKERIPGLVVSAAGAERVPTVCHVRISGVSPEALLPALDLEGIAASGGSACSSGAAAPSYVLTAMGVAPEAAAPAIRFSLGRTTTEEEIERVIEVVPAVVEQLRERAAA